MSLPDPNLPPDPFGVGPDLTQWATNIRAMFTACVTAGFEKNEALEISIRCMQAMMTKGMLMRAHVGPSVRLSAIIIRACTVCEGARELGKPCKSCGNSEPAQVTDLGVIASHQRSRWARLKWNLWGFRVAQRRIRRTNKEMLIHSLEGCGE